MGSIAYGLCAFASLLCFVLLLRGFLKGRSRLLLWSCLCFFFFVIQNSILFADLVLFPGRNLEFWRTAAGFAGALVLLCGLIWERR